jgi:hypothetical protein
VLELMRVDYPAHTRRDGTTANYSLYFGYSGLESTGSNRGELTCRTLPLTRDPAANCYTYPGATTFGYVYDYYAYFGMFLAGGGGRKRA